MAGQITATVLRLPDGRDLSFAEYGDPDGIPVFGFHGTPGSRCQLAPVEGMSVPSGIRVIAPDRPGYGFSSFQPRRRLVDWPADVKAIADHLRIERFGIFGLSGGGPHALVCAHAFGERLLGAACVSGVGPLRQAGAAEGMNPGNRLITKLGQRAPALMILLMRLQVAAMRRLPDRAFEVAIEKMLPEPDREVVRRPAVWESLTDELRRMPRTGGRAAAQDFEIFGSNWGFRLEEICIPVHFWQGDLDRNVPPHHVRILADLVRQAIVHDCPGEGHLLIFDRIAEVLAAASGSTSGEMGR